MLHTYSRLCQLSGVSVHWSWTCIHWKHGIIFPIYTERKLAVFRWLSKFTYILGMLPDPLSWNFTWYCDPEDKTVGFAWRYPKIKYSETFKKWNQFCKIEEYLLQWNRRSFAVVLKNSCSEKLHKGFLFNKVAGLEPTILLKETSVLSLRLQFGETFEGSCWIPRRTYLLWRWKTSRSKSFKMGQLSDFPSSTEFERWIISFKPFKSNVRYLYPLKISENQRFTDVFRRYGNGTQGYKRLIKSCVSKTAVHNCSV